MIQIFIRKLSSLLQYINIKKEKGNRAECTLPNWALDQHSHLNSTGKSHDTAHLESQLKRSQEDCFVGETSKIAVQGSCL